MHYELHASALLWQRVHVAKHFEEFLRNSMPFHWCIFADPFHIWLPELLIHTHTDTHTYTIWITRNRKTQPLSALTIWTYYDIRCRCRCCCYYYCHDESPLSSHSLCVCDFTHCIGWNIKPVIVHYKRLSLF